MFIAAQFTIAKYWKQPKCPSANAWIQKLCYIYTMEFYAAERKNEPFIPFAMAWMELESIMLSEIARHSKQILHYPTYIWNLFLKKVKLTVTEYRRGERGKLGGAGQEHKPSVIRWVNSGDLMYSMVTVVNNNALYTRNLLKE